MFTAQNIITQVVKKEGVDLDAGMTRAQTEAICKSIIKSYFTEAKKPIEKHISDL